MKRYSAIAAAVLVSAFPSFASAWLISPDQGADVRGWCMAINDSNQMVGSLGNGLGPLQAGSTHAFLAESNLETTDLGTFGGTSSAAVAISNTGLVAGWADFFLDTKRHAFVYADGTMTDLGTLGGHTSIPYAINDAGDVVGYSTLVGDASSHAFLYRSGTLIDLGTLGGSNSYAYALNEAGQVVGTAQLAGDTESHAFLWDNGTMTDLGSLGGTSSEARALNESGVVAGTSRMAGDAATHAFVYASGTMQDLGTLGGADSGANDVNEAGDVVGGAKNAAGVMRPYVWSAGVMTELAVSIPDTFGFAAAINDSGEIAGMITRTEAGKSKQRAFAWSSGTLTVQAYGINSIAYDINNGGISVGSFTDTVVEHDDGIPYSYELSRPAVWTGPCGNGVVDPGEDCDDGNIWKVDDCCTSTCVAKQTGTACADDGVACNVDLCDGSGQCLHTDGPRPVDTCLSADRARFQVKNSATDVSKDRVDWRWSGTGPLAQANLGDPATATDYSLCVWDYAAGAPSLATAIQPSRGDHWQSKDPKGWIYDGGAGGIKVLQIKTNADGSASAKLSARGLSLMIPAAVSATRYFAEDPKTVVQLLTSDGLCLTSEFSGSRRNDGTRYSGKQ